MNRISGGYRWRPWNWFGYFGNRLGHLLGILFQGQICLGNDSYAPFFAIYNGNPPDLMFLHQLFTVVDVLSFPAGDRIKAEEAVDLGIRRIKAFRHDAATQVAIGDHTQQLARGLVHDHRNRPNILVSQDFCNFLGAIFRRATYRVRSHEFTYFHNLPP